MAFTYTLKAIRGQLDAISETASKVFHEMPRSDRITHTDHVAGDQLGVSVDCRPRPNVATHAIAFDLRHCDALLFASNELPDFVNLNPLARKIDHDFVEVRGARFAEIQPK